MSDTTGNYLSQETLPTNSASTGKKGTTENFKWDRSDSHKALKDALCLSPKDIRRYLISSAWNF